MHQVDLIYGILPEIYSVQQKTDFTSFIRECYSIGSQVASTTAVKNSTHVSESVDSVVRGNIQMYVRALRSFKLTTQKEWMSLEFSSPSHFNLFLSHSLSNEDRAEHSCQMFTKLESASVFLCVRFELLQSVQCIATSFMQCASRPKGEYVVLVGVK